MPHTFTKRISFAFVLLMLLSLSAYAQKKKVEYLSKSGEKASKKEAYFKKTTTYEKEGAVVFETVNLRSDEVYEKGRYLSTKMEVKDGYFLERDGIKEEEGVYVNNERDSVWEFKRFGRLVKSVTYVNGLEEGSMKTYKDGNLWSDISMKEGKYHGAYKLYKGNIYVVEEGVYDMGFKVGTWRTYYSATQIEQQGDYEMGIKVGKWKSFYRSGVLKEEMDYKTGTEDVPAKEYFEPGEVKAKGMVNQGGRTGEWELFDNTGQLEWVGKYEYGLKEGLWKCRDKFGWFLEGDFKRGKVVGEYRCLDAIPVGEETEDLPPPPNDDGELELIIEEPVNADDDPVYQIVEVMPEFPGGQDELMRYLSENMRYPVLAKDMGLQGRVYVRFVVSKCGTIEDVEVIRGIGGGCDKEAIRVIKNMPLWKPGKQRGKRVRVQYNLPIHFTLR